MKFYEHVDLAKKFSGGPGAVSESVTPKLDLVAQALERHKRLSEAKIEEPKPIQLSAFPVPN